MNEKLILVGASGHGGVAADIARLMGYTDIAFLDDDPSATACKGYPVLGPVKEAGNYPQADFLVAIGACATRERVQTSLMEQGLHVVSLIHPGAILAKDAIIGTGTMVAAGAVIATGARLGEGCIVNTGATVDHDDQIGSYVHVSVGAHLAGAVTVGNRTWIGIGAVISNNLSICADTYLGAGAVVVKNITEPGTYIGVPARLMIKEKVMKNTAVRGGGDRNLTPSFINNTILGTFCPHNHLLDERRLFA